MSLFYRISKLGIALGLVVLLNTSIGGNPAPGDWLDPIDGLWATAREARPHDSGDLMIEGMNASVMLKMDSRGVPHIFAESDKDAIIALGFAVARDRLFQMDFIHRAATGTLSEIVGSGALPVDRRFRQLGVAEAVKRNAALLSEKSPREAETIGWYGIGVNHYLNQLEKATHPLEYRLLGVEPPKEFTAEFTMALLAYMTYDLSFSEKDLNIEKVQAGMSADDFNTLYPKYSSWEKTIVSDEDAHWAVTKPRDITNSSSYATAAGSWLNEVPIAEGFFEGKGSNNWAVNGSRSSTGAPILAGDMHLGLSLPAIWYEAHLVTPTTNVYGVTFPTQPAIMEGVTPDIAWAFTNTGSDQIDYYRLELNAERNAYQFDGQWKPLDVHVDTMYVSGSDPVIESRLISHIGPVLEGPARDYAVKWVGHEFGNTLSAIWDMNRATDYASFDKATRNWDYPMQNILYAGSDSIIAIRSTGYLPVRAHGQGFGVQDGTTSETAWIGRVPFDELPHAVSPDRGYLTSTNQRPAPETYPYYMGQDWRSIYRSRRIDDLLNNKGQHTPEDIASYQADVQSGQAELFLPLIKDIEGLTDAGQKLKSTLLDFDGNMMLESSSARLFTWFLDRFVNSVWDEDVFKGGSTPKEIYILDLIASGNETWFDVQGTAEVETHRDLLRLALDKTGEKWKEDGYADRTLGETQSLIVRHITRSEALKSLWRGPYPFPGYKETLSPAKSNPVYSSASWRVVVDFSTSPPTAKGVYPGGQSGNPLSDHYDLHMQNYVSFTYYPLSLSDNPDDIE